MRPHLLLRKHQLLPQGLHLALGLSRRRTQRPMPHMLLLLVHGFCPLCASPQRLVCLALLRKLAPEPVQLRLQLRRTRTCRAQAGARGRARGGVRAGPLGCTGGSTGHSAGACAGQQGAVSSADPGVPLLLLVLLVLLLLLLLLRPCWGLEAHWHGRAVPGGTGARTIHSVTLLPRRPCHMLLLLLLLCSSRWLLRELRHEHGCDAAATRLSRDRCRGSRQARQDRPVRRMLLVRVLMLQWNGCSLHAACLPWWWGTLQLQLLPEGGAVLWLLTQGPRVCGYSNGKGHLLASCTRCA